MSFDSIDIIEAAYQVMLPQDAWIDGVLRACAFALAAGQGVYGYLFDASGPCLEVLDFRSVPRNIEMERAMTALVQGVPREYVERTWLSMPFGLASQIPGSAELLEQGGAPYRDVLAVNGFDASGKGFWVGTTFARRAEVTGEVAAQWSRVAAHLGAGYRLRRRLAGARALTDGADALLEPDGTVTHAEGDAAGEEALHALRSAVVRISRARRREGSPTTGLMRWNGLVDARWSLVDAFDADGRHFVVAQSNEPSLADVAGLTPRERQVLACLDIGHSTKVVAYELGLAESTVRVLLARAAHKLGARTRAEAVERFRSQKSAASS